MRMDTLLLTAAADLLHCPMVSILRNKENYIGPDEEPISFDQVVEHARLMGLVLSPKAVGMHRKITGHSKAAVGNPILPIISALR